MSQGCTGFGLCPRDIRDTSLDPFCATSGHVQKSRNSCVSGTALILHFTVTDRKGDEDVEDGVDHFQYSTRICQRECKERHNFVIDLTTDVRNENSSYYLLTLITGFSIFKLKNVLYFATFLLTSIDVQAKNPTCVPVSCE